MSNYFYIDFEKRLINTHASEDGARSPIDWRVPCELRRQYRLGQ